MREVLSTVGLHLYQPPRRAFHHELEGIDTDPTHIDWTRRILEESYSPLSGPHPEAALNRASFDAFGVLRSRIREIDPDVSERMSLQLRENGVGDPYLHPILPDLSESDKRILIFAGINAFDRETGVTPSVFWAPETALDYDTLNVLADAGYEGFVCAPEQIQRSDKAWSANRPTLIRVSEGRRLIALPFERGVSEQLAFNPKVNADDFVRDFMASQYQRRENGFMIAWTDGETFGHHNRRSIRFLEYLLSHAMENQGFIPVSVNLLLSFAGTPAEGFLNERSAWSCPHGDLVRWHGECPCGENHDLRWKSVFYDAVHRLNAEVTEVVSTHLPDFENYLYEEFEAALTFAGGASSTMEESLLAAKANALAALTSCGTFFEDPHTSGNINVLFAVAACLHLHDAGFSDEADRIMESFKYRLRWMPNWTYEGHPGTVIGDFLTK